MFLPDGKSYATVSTDGLLRRWDTEEALKHHKAMEEKNGEAKPEVPKPLQSVQATFGPWRDVSGRQPGRKTNRNRALMAP